METECFILGVILAILSTAFAANCFTVTGNDIIISHRMIGGFIFCGLTSILSGLAGIGYCIKNALLQKSASGQIDKKTTPVKG